MKKLLLSVCAGVASVCAFAQPTVLPQPVKGKFETPVKVDTRGSMSATIKNNRGGQRYTRSQWYSFTDWMRAQGQTLQPTALLLFGDSAVKNVFLDQDNNVVEAWNTWISAGAMFDAKDDIFGDSALSVYNRQTLDSVAIWYAYTRKAETYFDEATQTTKPVVDTLIIAYGTGAAISTYSWQQSGEVFGTVGWNRSKKTTIVPTGQELRIPLTIEDTSTVLWRPRTFYTNKLAIAAGGLAVATIQFRSGVPYKPGDTLVSPADTTIVPAPKTKLNEFQLRTWIDQNAIPLAFYNNGLLLDRTQFWKDRLAGGYGSKFLPSSYYVTRQYPEVWFHTTATGVGIAEKEMQNGYGAGNVYPNPAVGNASFEFALGNSENVKVQLYNVVGQPVATLANGTYAAGKHTMSFSTQSMKAGMYFYTITAGDFVKTVRFNVAQ